MKALVLSGGGAKGAFQVGGLQYILGFLQKRYDVFAGISVGALNTSYLSMFSEGREQEAIKGLSSVWDTVDDSRIYKLRYPWLGSHLSVMLSSVNDESLYDSQPLIDLVKSTLDPSSLLSSGKILRVGAVSLTTGVLRHWGENSADIVKAVIASSAFPGFFKPVKIDNEVWMDGGVREVVPVKPVVDIGVDEIDIIATSPEGLENKNMNKFNVISSSPRIIDTMSEEIMENDIELAKRLRDEKGIKVRILRPDHILVTNPLDFDPVKIQKNMNLGYEQALKVDWYG